MKIFEFHFNPQAKPDLIFDSFYYEPSTASEKKLGSLYIVGELKNAIPQNQKLITSLAQLLKKEYYSGSLPEPALKRALKKANEFLAEKTRLGNIGWLGNLSIAAINSEGLNVSFSKDGSVKILLLRPGQITDMGKPLEIEEFEPYPLKIFTNIIGGKFLENDKILVLTKEIFEFFSNRDFFEKLSFITDERGLKTFFKERENYFAQLSGVCLLILLNKEGASKSAQIFKKPALRLSLKEMLLPLAKFLIAVRERLSGFRLPRKPRLSLLNPLALIPKTKFKKPVFDFRPWRPKLPEFKFDWKEKQSKKNLFLVSVFIILLSVGFLVSKRESEANQKKLQNQLIEAREKTVRAEDLLSNNEKRANALFKEVFVEILPLSKEDGQLGKDALVLKGLVEKNLNKLNKIEEVKDLKTIFDFNGKDFTPQRLMFFENKLYFLNPLEKRLIELKENSLNKIEVNQGFSWAAASSEGLFLFAKPNKVFVFKNNQLEEVASLKLPSVETVFGEMVFYKDAFYFLEKTSGNVVKYQQPLSKNKDGVKQWIFPSERTALEARSFTVDGSLYVLTRENSLWRYYAGRLERTMSLTFFPFPENLTRIVLSPLAYFAILEPEQNRIILIDKSGIVIKQFQNEGFAGLKDVAFSPDGRTLYVLSGLKVYQLSVAF